MANEKFGGFTDKIVQARIHEQRDQFIRSITNASILNLASSHRPEFSCDFFKDPERGSYNICYFVEFHDGKRWVIRVPLAPCLCRSASSKLESEIATMQLVAQKTTIPIPRILAYELSDCPEPLKSYLILEYVDGRSISPTELKSLTDQQQQCLYTSLADIYIQLRRLTFESIGCLARTLGSVGVHKGLTTIDINRQELEGMEPSRIQGKYMTGSNTMASANAYTEMLLELADNAFKKSPARIFDEEQGQDALYHLDLFRRFATEAWLDQNADQGPFVLVHGDLRLPNILVNEKMEIISVLDWEWSKVVPLQFFQPPLWLTGFNPPALACVFFYERFMDKFNELVEIMRDLERKKYGDELLSSEWAKAAQRSGFLVANALENWTDMDAFALDYINVVWFNGYEDTASRVARFIQDDPARAILVERLCDAHKAYESKLKALRGDLDDDRVDGTAKDNGKTVPNLTDGVGARVWTLPIPISISPPPIIITVGTLIILGVSWWRNRLRRD